MLASTIVFLGLLLTGQIDETWEVFKSDEGGFTVEMPQDREQTGSVPSSGPTGRVTKHEVVRQPGGVQYWIIRYESQSMVPLNALDKWMDFACDEAATRFDRSGKVTKSKFQAGVLSGQEFNVTSESGLHRVRGRTYVNEPNVYVQVAVSSYPDKALPDTVDRFFKSFRLGPPPRPSSQPGTASPQPGMGGFPGFNIQTKRSVTKSKMGGSTRTDSVVIGATPKSGRAGSWQTVTSKEGGFTVQMPSQPNGCENEGGMGFSITKLSYASQTLELIAMAVQGPTELPEAEREKVLVRARDKALSGAGTGLIVVSEEPITAGELEGRQYELTLDKLSVGKVQARGRAFSHGKGAYALFAVSRVSNQPLPPDANRFLESFALVGANSEVASAKPAPAAKAKAKGRMPRSKVAPAAKGSVQWGKEVDPDGDVTIESSGSTLSMRIPPTPHVLAPNMNTLNAPRVVASVSGDFVAKVQVDGAFSPGPQSTTPKLSSRQAGGLILWKDSENHIVLQRRTVAAGKDGTMTRQVIFDEHVSTGKGESHNAASPQGSVFLRLERHGSVITGFLSGDGQVWKPLKPIDAPWATGTLQVGVMAVNTSTEPHFVTFDNYSLTPK
jgi:regulation of enolase protein 1 (concanavalin A-like superfamily)